MSAHRSVTEEEYAAFVKDHRDAADLRSERADLHLLLVAAARCGFVNKNQEDAIFFALEKITGEPREVLKLTIDVTPKGYNGTPR